MAILFGALIFNPGILRASAIPQPIWLGRGIALIATFAVRLVQLCRSVGRKSHGGLRRGHDVVRSLHHRAAGARRSSARRCRPCCG
ncbi:MAG: hypothetical protein MZV49_01100 [Rhodopseudomonas palustris]|nr:hypothetical protein [Rhodopseudomonas palustris]